MAASGGAQGAQEHFGVVLNRFEAQKRPFWTVQVCASVRISISFSTIYIDKTGAGKGALPLLACETVKNLNHSKDQSLSLRGPAQFHSSAPQSSAAGMISITFDDPSRQLTGSGTGSAYGVVSGMLRCVTRGELWAGASLAALAWRTGSAVIRRSQ